MNIDPSIRIFVAGHRGMVGSAIERRLRAGGYTNLITYSRRDLDLVKQRAVLALLVEQLPKYRFATEAKVGSIQANNHECVDAMSAAQPRTALP